MKENDIEHLIEIERATLRKCVNLLQYRIPLADWPDDVRTAFLLAVRIKDEKGESYKAFRTARHLRLKIENLPDPTKESTRVARRCAERIRADLIKLVKLGAAEYLVRENGDRAYPHDGRKNVNAPCAAKHRISIKYWCGGSGDDEQAQCKRCHNMISP